MLTTRDDSADGLPVARLPAIITRGIEAVADLASALFPGFAGAKFAQRRAPQQVDDIIKTKVCFGHVPHQLTG